MAKNKELTLEEKLKEALIPKEEQPYEIPESWEWSLMDIIVDVRDGTHDSPAFIEKGFPLITSKNLKNGRIDFENTKNISKEDMRKINYRSRVEVGDILYAMIGTIGNPVYINNDSLDSYAVKNVAIFKPYIRNTSKFLLYYLESFNFFKEIENKIKGSTQKFIPLNILRKVKVPLPPLEEQKRIVEKLEFMFEKINKAKDLIKEVKENIENRKESILNKAFRGELTAEWRKNNQNEDAIELLKSINEEKIKNWEQACIEAKKNGKKKPSKPKIEEILNILISKKEEPYEIPKNWEWIKLGSIGEYKKGPFGSSLTKSIFVSKGENTIKVYEQKNAIQKNWKLGNYYISEKYFKENMTSFEVRANDIIVSCAGTIGESYIMPLEIEKGIINQALMKIRLFSDIDYKYFLKYFDYILKKMSNSYSKGSAIKNIPPFKIFKLLPFALPPLKEQEEIVRILDEILEKESKIKELIKLEETIELLEKSILDKVFRGKLGTQNKDDEPAIELLKKIL